MGEHADDRAAAVARTSGASASPLTGEVDTARRIADAGAAAIVMPSLFEEEILRMSHATTADPAAFERANYHKVLHSWTAPMDLTPVSRSS